MMDELPDKYFNPFTDFGFKKLFGEEASKDLLIDFLNALLPQAGVITDLTFGSTEHQGRSEFDRKAVFDLYCTNQSGERIIVEMQKAKQNFFKDRALFYATFPIQEQAQKGNWNFELKAIYSVGILDFVFAEDRDSEEYYHHMVGLKDLKTNQLFYEKLLFVYLEMPKFKKTEAELVTNADKWLYVLKNLPRLQKCPVRLQEKIFAKVFSLAELATMNKAQWLEYEASLKVYRDMNNVIDTAVGDAVAPLKVQLAENELVISQQGQALAENERVISQQEQALAENERVISQQGQALAQAVRSLHRTGMKPAAIATSLGLDPALIEKILGV